MNGTIIFFTLDELTEFLALWATRNCAAGFDVTKTGGGRWELTFNGSN